MLAFLDPSLQSSAGCGTRAPYGMVCKTKPFRFLAGYHKGRLVHALSVFVLSLRVSSVFVLFPRATLTMLLYILFFFCMFSPLVVLVRLSVPVQVIDGKDSSAK